MPTKPVELRSIRPSLGGPRVPAARKGAAMSRPDVAGMPIRGCQVWAHTLPDPLG